MRRATKPAPTTMAAMSSLRIATLMTVTASTTASPSSIAGTDGDLTPEKRWFASSFTLRLSNTEPFLKKDDMMTALQFGADQWNSVGGDTEILGLRPAIRLEFERGHNGGDDGDDDDGDSDGDDGGNGGNGGGNGNGNDDDDDGGNDPNGDVVYSAGGDTGESVALDGVNRVSLYRGEWPYPPQAGAVTVAWAKANSNPDGDPNGPNTIVEADLALNPSFAWALDQDGTTGLYDLKNVFTHELGHALGLPDIKDPREATMFYLILPGETLKRDLSEEDTRMLLELYENVDTNTAGCNAAGAEGSVMGAVVLGGLGAVSMLRRVRSSRRASA